MTLSFANELADPQSYLPPAPTERGPKARNATSARTGDTRSMNGGQDKVNEVVEYISSYGFVFEPWQVAAFIAAVRTKPFVILAGISGTGKTKLPRLVAEATGAEHVVVPVSPNWTDSSDLLGFERITGTFQPGSLLRFAKRAIEEPEKQFFFVLDEMNIARVEYYLAEVLSFIEERRPDTNGRIVSQPMIPNAPDGSWSNVRLPDNLCIVGSVNMDETTHGFSRKVLDRAFVIEFSDVDLAAVGAISKNPKSEPWLSYDWRAAALTLAEHPARNAPEVSQIIETLITINKALTPGQLQVGYRVRDEIVMFCLAAQESSDSFTTSNAGTVDPLDIAIAMKILPRIQGGGQTIRAILKALQEWAAPESDNDGTAAARKGFPFCAERISIMNRRLKESGFTSYWL